MSKVMEIPVEFRRLLDRDWREAAVYGGRFSGKSHTVARILLIRARQEKTRVLCSREMQNSIADSSHQLLADLIRAYDLNDFEVTNNAIINKINGSDFLFKGFHRNEQGIKSTEGIDIAWCLVGGTKVDGRNIEAIRPGDYVRSYNHKTGLVEYRKVLRATKRKSPEILYRLLIQGGTNVIIGTGEHPVYVVGRGYTPLSKIVSGDIIYAEEIEHSRRSSVSWKLWGDDENGYTWKKAEVCKKWWYFLLGLCKEKYVGKNEGEQSNERYRCEKKNGGVVEKERAQTESAWGKWSWLYGSATETIRVTWSWLVERVSYNDWKDERFANTLQGRPGEYILQISNRMRRGCTPWSCWKNGRQEKKRFLRECRVDSVALQKQTDIKGNGLSDGGDFVYNIEVEVNNNYFANGILTHNCEESQSISNTSIEILTPTVRKPGSQIIYTYNRLNEEDPVHKRLVLEGRPNTLVINVNYDVAVK